MNWVGVGTKTAFIANDDMIKKHAYLEGLDSTYLPLLTAFINAACERVEQIVGRPLMYASAIVYARPDNHCIYLPKGSTITKVEFWDSEIYEDQTSQFTSHIIDQRNVYSIWRNVNLVYNAEYKITVTFTPEITDNMKHCARLMTAQMWENRENQDYKAPNTMVDVLLHNETMFI